ncbi:unnamed protein product [Spirodela intermedia]|uniref:Uncharacterized protein n=1 Tax=Spirodela intermedia TaxID=51605 RepID=A0ABN7EDE1_SPIIN|nr:unnamed protein product [Spirodela intermedia]
MRQRCTGILSIWKDHHAMSMASKALLGQGRCGQSLDLLANNESLSPTCTTTPCPTAGWLPVTWKGSDTHVPHRS